MKVYKSINKFIGWRTKNKSSVGFVPTMGALHDGHLSLINQSIKQTDVTIVSIFLNKLQFGPKEDFEKYPKNLQNDLDCLSRLRKDNSKKLIVFIPAETEMYHDNFSTTVIESKISKKLEGKSRPDFFCGVTTIVSKLFNLVKPSRAYFGMKDIQQLVVIKQLVFDLNYNIKIVECNTIREANGLAMSSRNKYLTKLDKQNVAIIYKSLVAGKSWLQQEVPIKNIKENMKKMLQQKNINIDYISIANLNTFTETTDVKLRPIVISVALWYKKIRLIDNVVIK